MLLFVYWIIFVVGFVITWAVFFWFPEYIGYFAQENSWLEKAQAVLYFCSFLVAGVAIAIEKRKKIVPAFFAAMGMLFFLDEISWGIDILKYEPRVIVGIEIDAVHDFVDVFIKMLHRYGDNFFFVLLLFVGSATLISMIYQHRNYLADLLTRRSRSYLLIIFTLLFFSSAIDAKFLKISVITTIYPPMLEEYFEFGVALAMLFLCVGLFKDSLNGEFRENNKGDHQKIS